MCVSKNSWLLLASGCEFTPLETGCRVLDKGGRRLERRGSWTDGCTCFRGGRKSQSVQVCLWISTLEPTFVISTGEGNVS